MNDDDDDFTKEGPLARKFVAYFDVLGFECLVDITSYERRKLLAEISGAKVESPVDIKNLVIRATYNPQRNPEIWVFTSTVDEVTLSKLVQDDPQVLVDTIRECGHNVYGQHKHKRQVIK
tara:strand:+ start:1148 stop:1507 length:360 start_codon:yes stop_codon:yes gene_type:complete